MPSLRCSSFPCLILRGHTVCNLRVKEERCVTAGGVAEDTFARAATTLHSVEEPISSVQKCITPNHFFVRLNFVLTDTVNISEELEFFCLLFYFFPFSSQ